MSQDSQKPDKVYYFGTCLMDSIYPQAGLAGLKIIRREGIQVIYPRQQSCCGQPAYNSGFPKEAKKVALKQVRLFTENYPIVVPSGSCAGMMKHHYPLLFEGDKNLQRVRQFSERVVELSEPRATDQSHLAFILPCHEGNARHRIFKIAHPSTAKR